MKRYSFAKNGLFPRAGTLLAGLTMILLSPAAVLAQGGETVVLGGLYRGFSQSNVDPRFHPYMELTIDGQNGSDFIGTLLLGAPDGLRATFEGKLVDRLGSFKGRATGEFGEVRFTGIFQSLGDTGALVRASYRSIFLDGTQDQGVTSLLRSFSLPDLCVPPDPCTPPDLAGDWSGQLVSDQFAQIRGFTMEIDGDGTSFMGGGEISGNDFTTTLGTFMLVGTVGVAGNFVYIGVSDTARVLGGGASSGNGVHVPDILYGSATFEVFNGAVDFGRFTLNPLQR